VAPNRVMQVLYHIMFLRDMLLASTLTAEEAPLTYAIRKVRRSTLCCVTVTAFVTVCVTGVCV
jgi:hypothetical protein